MERIKEAIIVEGRYDKNKLKQIVDACIIETSGFHIFSDKETRKLIESLAQKRGIIILTDSDSAGFLIRNFLNGCIDPKLIKHAYIPDIIGKEARKTTWSAERKLGVEGIPDSIIIKALKVAGATFESNPESKNIPHSKSTKADLFAKGLSGRSGSCKLRAELLKAHDLPAHLSSNNLLDVLNALYTKDEFYSIF